MSSGITKISETYFKDSGNWDEWPYPTVTIESVISGELRVRILDSLGRENNGCEIHLIETNVSGGYSEYTQENEYSIEVQIDGKTVWKVEYNDSSYSAMAQFLRRFFMSVPMIDDFLCFLSFLGYCPVWYKEWYAQ